MRITLTILLLTSLFLVQSVIAQAGSNGQNYVGKCFTYVRGERYVSRVTADDLERTPIWAENADAPPLPAREALKQATSVLSALKLDVGQWRVADVSLQPVGGGGHWIYLVTFFEDTGDRPSAGAVAQMTIVVLMNGRAIVPTLTTSDET